MIVTNINHPAHAASGTRRDGREQLHLDKPLHRLGRLHRAAVRDQHARDAAIVFRHRDERPNARSHQPDHQVVGAFREKVRLEQFLQPEDHQIVVAGQIDEFVEGTLRLSNDPVAL